MWETSENSMTALWTSDIYPQLPFYTNFPQCPLLLPSFSFHTLLLLFLLPSPPNASSFPNLPPLPTPSPASHRFACTHPSCRLLFHPLMPLYTTVHDHTFSSSLFWMTTLPSPFLFLCSPVNPHLPFNGLATLSSNLPDLCSCTILPLSWGSSSSRGALFAHVQTSASLG